MKPSIARTNTSALKSMNAAHGLSSVRILAQSILWPKTRWPPIISANRPPGTSVKTYPKKKLPKIVFCSTVFHLNLCTPALPFCVCGCLMKKKKREEKKIWAQWKINKIYRQLFKGMATNSRGNGRQRVRMITVKSFIVAI